jgi:hypothetical protein
MKFYFTKKLTILLAVIAVTTMFFTGCGDSENPSEVLQGYKNSSVFQKDGEEQSYDTYEYDESFDSKFAKDDDYIKVTADNIEEITGYFNDFESWAKVSSFKNDYKFTTDMITEGDYYTIPKEQVNNDSAGLRKLRTLYRMYSLYYYDTETHTLHHIYSDITD